MYASYDHQLEDRYFACDYDRPDTDLEQALKNKLSCIEEAMLSMVKNLYSNKDIDVVKLEDDISEILWKLECAPQIFIEGTLDIQRQEKQDVRGWERSQYDQIMNSIEV